MTDRLDVFTTRSAELGAKRARARAAARRRRRRVYVLLLAVLLLVTVVVGGGYYLYRSYFAVPDFEGTGQGEVVVQVADGDSTTQIAGVLAREGVVASAGAFTEAAADEDRVRAIQPGYYQLRAGMSGESAVALLLDPPSRVGRLEIRGGVQLDDTRAPDGSVVPGVLSLISQATCSARDGQRQCITADELRSTMAGTDPAELGVPAWAVADVSKAEPARRLEGLLVPGLYDVHPGTPAVDVLRELLTVSGARLEATGLVAGAKRAGYSPYQLLVISSLVEKEGITAGHAPGRAGDLQPAGRRAAARAGLHRQLPARPAGAAHHGGGPGAGRAVQQLRGRRPAADADRRSRADAIAAALAPEAGPWLFFVRCQPDGTSCFADDAGGAPGQRAAGPGERGLLSRAGCPAGSAQPGRPKNPGGGVGEGTAVASVTAAASPVNRRRAAPTSTRAGNGSPATRRARAAAGRSAAPTSTTLPNRRPRSTSGAATTASSPNTLAAVATWARTNGNGATSARFAA